jgi:hypothetical protein
MTQPFLRVAADDDGTPCWEVVVPGRARSRVLSGLAALELLRALSAATGGPTPRCDG